MNSIFVLFPVRNFGIWSFDDNQRGLVSEPFVGQTNDLIDQMAEESGHNVVDGLQIALLFSHIEFPDHQCNLSLEETSPYGTTYDDADRDLLPWLCPAFFKYFPQAPPKLYGAVKKP